MRKTNYTFLLPAFKSSYLEEALLSIRQQTFTNFVCLVSDDCSPENLKSIYDQVVGNDSRFTYRRNTENMGGKSLVSHWNLLVDMCETEYLIMASDDDVYDLRFLEEVDKLTNKYSEVNLVRVRVNQIDTQGNLIAQDSPRDEYEDIITFLYNQEFVKARSCMANYVFRTSTLKQDGRFPECPMAFCSDQIAAYRSALAGVVIPKEPLFSFRISDIHLSSLKNTEQITALVEGTKELSAFMQDLLQRLSPSDTLASHRLDELREKSIDNILEFMAFTATALPLKQFIPVYRYLGRAGYFKFPTRRIPLICSWIKKHL